MSYDAMMMDWQRQRKGKRRMDHELEASLFPVFARLLRALSLSCFSQVFLTNLLWPRHLRDRIHDTKVLRIRLRPE